MEDTVKFCPNCGTPNNASDAQPQAPMQNGYQQVIYQKPKRPGKGLGIASLVLSIIGLVYCWSVLFASIAFCAVSHGLNWDSITVNDVAELEQEMQEFDIDIDFDITSSDIETLGESLELVVKIGFCVIVAVVSIFSILAFIFSLVSRKKGYKCGISTAGFVMSIIGLAVYALSFVIVILA